MLSGNCGYIKHLGYISLLESINVNLLQLLFRAKENHVLVGLILLLDAHCCCSAGKYLSLVVISVPHQSLVVTGLISRSSFPLCLVHKGEEHGRCYTKQCRGLPCGNASSWTPGKKRIDCSQMRCFLLSPTERWWLPKCPVILWILVLLLRKTCNLDFPKQPSPADGKICWF